MSPLDMLQFTAQMISSLIAEGRVQGFGGAGEGGGVVGGGGFEYKTHITLCVGFAFW